MVSMVNVMRSFYNHRHSKFMGFGVPGGGSHIKVTGVIVALLEVEIRGLVPIRVLKSKVISVRA